MKGESIKALNSLIPVIATTTTTIAIYIIKISWMRSTRQTMLNNRNWNALDNMRGVKLTNEQNTHNIVQSYKVKVSSNPQVRKEI